MNSIRSRRTVCAAMVIGFFLIHAGIAQEKRSLLSSAYPPSALPNLLLQKSDWLPFPTAAQRDVWLNLPDTLRADLLKRGERLLNYQWQALPATVFLEFSRNGNRSHYQNLRDQRRHALADLVLAECIERDGRFLDDLVNGIWTICEETYWGVPAHLSMQRRGYGLPDPNEPTVDLFVSETAGLLAWTYYLLHEPLGDYSPLIQERIESEIQRRILTPCLERDDFWWMGFKPQHAVNNWNPWINSNWLTCALIIEKDEQRRQQSVAKIMRSLDVFIDSYPEDGGCDEGPAYWNRAGASLFDCLELLHSGSAGRIDIYDQPLIRAMARYIVHAHIAENYFINFADAPAIVNLEADLTYRFGRRIHDDQLADFGGYIADLQRKRGHGISGSLGRQLPAIFNDETLANALAKPPLLRDVWMEGNQVMAARSEAGSARGLYVAAQGGHNQESHNHNDVGNFIVYLNGKPMIIDVGVETYTRKTFSDERYEIWTMQSGYHNLPTVNGVMQKDGRQFAARDVVYDANDDFAQLTLDIAGAYPEEAGVTSWIRSIRLNRGDNVEITERIELNAPSADVVLNLMTVCRVENKSDGALVLCHPDSQPPNHKLQLHLVFDAEKWTASSETISITDSQLQAFWGDTISRIQLKANHAISRETAVYRLRPVN